ncbi:MAG: excinuclease ABC subunit UvrC [Thermodesulfovibrionales bacterium]
MLEKLADIPERPGIYLFRDAGGRVLYVGKAKGLKTRVRSYFQKSSSLDARKTAMVALVRDCEYTVTSNELEAFILEATLIKQYRPRYNILLRDDKSYPYLRLTLSEKWPRLDVVRRIRKDGSKYFGPYVPSGGMWELLSFIRKTFRIPTCSYSLDKRMRPCIQHQINKCIAPCGGAVDHELYMRTILEIRLILEGKNKKLIGQLEKQMAAYSQEMRYEEAAVLRDRIRAVRTVCETQNMVAPELGDMDVIGLARDESRAAFKLLFIRSGITTGYRQFLFSNVAGEPDPGMMKSLIEQFYLKEVIAPPVIAVSVLPEDKDILSQWLEERKGARVRIVVPSRGARRQLISMAIENAEVFLRAEKHMQDRGSTGEIAEFLGIQPAPADIGAFDISNISGRDPVGGYVYWADGGFRKEQYRHIKMDAISGPDDFAMMHEMVRRTFGRPGAHVPDLVIIDGGPGQLQAALRALQELRVRTAVVCIAKDPDRAFIPGRAEPAGLEGGGSAGLLLRRIRDEVHRFAIGYHKKLRARRILESPLDAIPGIGRKRRLELLRHFGSLEGIRRASLEELISVRGVHRRIAEEILRTVNTTTKGGVTG